MLIHVQLNFFLAVLESIIGFLMKKKMCSLEDNLINTKVKKQTEIKHNYIPIFVFFLSYTCVYRNSIKIIIKILFTCNIHTTMQSFISYSSALNMKMSLNILQKYW